MYYSGRRRLDTLDERFACYDVYSTSTILLHDRRPMFPWKCILICTPYLDPSRLVFTFLYAVLHAVFPVETSKAETY